MWTLWLWGRRAITKAERKWQKTLLLLVTTLLPTAPGSWGTGTAVHAVVARRASVTLSPVMCFVLCECEGQEISFQLTFSWGGCLFSLRRAAHKEQWKITHREEREEGDYEGTTAGGSRDSYESSACEAPKVLRESRSLLVQSQVGLGGWVQGRL